MSWGKIISVVADVVPPTNNANGEINGKKPRINVKQNLISDSAHPITFPVKKVDQNILININDKYFVHYGEN